MVGVDGHEDDDEFEGREIPSRSDPAAIVGGTSLTGLSFSLQPRGGVTEDTDRLKKHSMTPTQFYHFISLSGPQGRR